MPEEGFIPTTGTWIGDMSEVERCLNAAGADQDENHVFLLEAPSGTLTFLGDSRQALVTSDMVFYVSGEPKSLLALMTARGTFAGPAAKEYGEDE